MQAKGGAKGKKGGGGGTTICLVLALAAVSVVYFTSHVCMNAMEHKHVVRLDETGIGMNKEAISKLEKEKEGLQDQLRDAEKRGSAHSDEKDKLKDQLRAKEGELAEAKNQQNYLQKFLLRDVVYRNNGEVRKITNTDAAYLKKWGHLFVPEYAPGPKLTLAVLVRNEFPSFAQSLNSWVKEGLIDYVDEFLIMFNNWDARNQGDYDRLIKLPDKARAIYSPQNVPIMAALNWLNGNATGDLILFLEKDFRVIEGKDQIKNQLDTGKRLLDREEASVVRYRHRKFPGEPHYADYIYKGREDAMLRNQPNLLCHAVHWLVNPELLYPDKLWKCKAEPHMFCTKAEHCGWTNNPSMYRRNWWIDNFKHTMDLIYTQDSLAADLEYFTNWNGRAWTPRGYIVALGDGLFEHAEVDDHQEPDYAGDRKRVFAEDQAARDKIENEARAIATEDAKIGVHNDWVRRSNEILNYRYKNLQLPFIFPEAAPVTIVTCLFDLKRGDLNNNFKRPFSMYTEHLKNRFMKIKMPKIIYIENSTYPLIKDGIDEQTEIRYRTLEDMERMLGPGNFERLTKLRTDSKWYGQAGWLTDSPQATLKDYNSIVMTKIFLLADVARTNPFQSKYFVWIDAKHDCINADKIKLENMKIFFEHMNGGFLMTYYNYGPNNEVHGFEWKALNRYSKRALGDNSPYKVVRGGVFGGTREYVEAVADVYYQAMNSTIHDGVMGTEENLFSIVMYNFPRLVHEFSNDNACAESSEKDHACPGFNQGGGNCAIFNWMYNGPNKRQG